MILEVKQAPDNHLQAVVTADGEPVENLKVVKSFNDHGKRRVVCEITFEETMRPQKKAGGRAASRKTEEEK